MSTPRVPGYIAANNDTLHDKCWAERTSLRGKHLLFIDRIEADRVSFTEHRLADLKQFAGAADLNTFNRLFSDCGWTWHDKSARPNLPVVIDAVAETVEAPFPLEHARAE